MRKLILLLILGLGCCPLWAQFYSYRDANGRLHITDRPLTKKGYKLVDTYVPRDLREKRKRQQAQDARRSRIGRSKHRLSHGQIDGLVSPIARAYKVDPDLVKAVIEIESSRDARAKSSKGAMGLMQLIPATAERFGVSNAWDPRQNVKGGIRYLQYLLSYFEGNVDLALAGYNAGENAVDRHQGVPPYKETRNYIRKIRKLYKVKQLPYGNRAKRKSVLVRKQSAPVLRTADAAG